MPILPGKKTRSIRISIDSAEPRGARSKTTLRCGEDVWDSVVCFSFFFLLTTGALIEIAQAQGRLEDYEGYNSNWGSLGDHGENEAREIQP